jgi:RimJ/RimL family protein N-acetyltransferase
VEPVEVNAGAWYLRALRADERVDDRPALLAMAQDEDSRRYTGLRGVVDLPTAGARVAASARGWAQDTCYGWAVCEPSTGEMLAELTLREVHLDERWAEIGCVTAPAHRGRGIVTTAVGAVLRLAFADERLGGLGLHRVVWRHDPGNAASAAVALRCGFTPEGVARGAGYDQRDLVVLARLASD